MTEATLNANNYICRIRSIFHMCMYDRIKNVYAKIFQAYIVPAYGKQFITDLFEEPSYDRQCRINFFIGTNQLQPVYPFSENG